MILQLARWFGETITADAITHGNSPPVGDELTRQSTELLLGLHPEQLLRFLEEAWAYRQAPVDRPDLPLPKALLNGVVPGLESGVRDMLANVTDSIYDPPLQSRGIPSDTGSGADWDHLVYGYLIENTRAVDICRRVLLDYLYSERLEVPSPVTRQWLRATESLFFRDLPAPSIGAITSTLRPDFAATRRNAFHRMLGMDLNHGRDDGQPYPYVHATAANTGFVPMFEDLLREVWIAAENFKNTSGTNPKDDAAIANLARDIRDMLRTRRQQGNLAREEFWIVTMASWFHLILESNNSVVTDLKSNAGSPEERLRKIGDRVGLKPHVHAESFFILAPRLSVLLKRIEAGDYNSPSSVSVLYSENAVPPPNPIRKDMLDIINQWSIATGRDMKARRTTITPRTATPRPPSKPLSPAGVLSTSNGSKS
jgi:hypothetical protein